MENGSIILSPIVLLYYMTMIAIAWQPLREHKSLQYFHCTAIEWQRSWKRAGFTVHNAMNVSGYGDNNYCESQFVVHPIQRQIYVHCAGPHSDDRDVRAFSVSLYCL